MGLRDFFARWRKEKSAPGPGEEKEDSRPEKSGEVSGEAAAGEDVSGGSAYDEAFMAEHFEGLGEVWFFFRVPILPHLCCSTRITAGISVPACCWPHLPGKKPLWFPASR